jgi:O-antigen/teichoic acid export membrane protein
MFFAATLSGTIVSAVIGIWMALKGFGAWALVAQQISNVAIDTIILIIASRFRLVFKFSVSRFKKLFAFGFNLFLAGIINKLYAEIRPLFVGIRFSTTDLAFYTKGLHYPQMINTVMNDTFASVLFPVMSKVQDDLTAVSGMTRRFIRLCSYIVFPAMLGLFAVADNLFVLLLTEKWSPIIIYVKIFSVANMFDIVQRGNLLPIRAIGRSDVILKLDILKKTIYFIILFFFLVFSQTPHILATMGVLVSLVAFFINSYVTQKLIHYRINRQIMDLIENLIPAAAMCVIVSLMNRLPVYPVLLLGIQIISGATLYCILSVILKNESFFYLLDFLKAYYKKTLQ